MLDPITIASATKAANGELNSALSLILTVAQWIYKKITETKVKPIEDVPGDPHRQDKTQYDLLCSLRRELSDQKAIPEQWVLVDNCPVYQSNFQTNYKEIVKRIEELDKCHHLQKRIVVSLLSEMQHLFEVLDRRSLTALQKLGQFTSGWYAYRPDSYEAMFFSDLALWLSVVFPLRDIEDPETETLLKQWIDYCKKVQVKVLVYRDDDTDPYNPKSQLDRIIAGLTVLLANIHKANQASSFNHKIQRINESILNMSKSVFDIFHLLLKDAPRREMQVTPLLEQAAKKSESVKDPDAQHILKYLMGQWIVETLKRAGITSNSFESTLDIDIDAIPQHISRDFTKIKDLSSTGLWGFARKDKRGNDDREIANRHLNQVVDLHRSVLMLYFVQRSVVLGALVSQAYGEAWVYGEDTGKAVVDALLNVINDAVQKLCHGVDDLYTQYQAQYYEASKKQRDMTAPCYRAVAELTDLVTKIKAYRTSIETTIGQIRQATNSYEEKQNDIRDKERALKRCLHAYARVAQLDLGSVLHELETLESTLPHVTTNRRYLTQTEEEAPLDSTEEIVVGFRKTSLPFYSRTEGLLGDLSQSIADEHLYDCTVLARPEHFHSNIQQYMYENFLNDTGNRLLMNYLPEWLFFIPHRQMTPFTMLYYRVNTAMKLLYEFYPAASTPVSMIQSMESILADVLINKLIIKAFQEYDFYTLGTAWPKALVEVRVADDHVQIVLTEEWTQFIKGALLENVQNALVRQSQEQALQLQKVMEENDKMRAESMEKDRKLAETQAELVETKAELTEAKAGSARKDTKLAESQAELMHTKAKLAELMHDVQALTESASKPPGAKSHLRKHSIFFKRKPATASKDDALKEHDPIDLEVMP